MAKFGSLAFVLLFAALAGAQALLSPVLIPDAETRRAFYRAYSRGELLMAAGRPEDALGAYREAIRAAPFVPEGHHGYQDARERVGLTEDVVKEYRERLAQNPEDGLAHYLLGRIARDLEEKERLFRKALELAPELQWAAYGLGYLYERLERWEESEAAFQRAIAISPRWAEAHHGLGFCYMNQGKNEPAERQFERALELAPRHFDAHINLSVVVLRRGDHERAAQLCLSALDIEPENPEALNNLGKAYYAARRYRAAARVFEQALRTGKSDTPEVLHLNRAFCFVQTRELDRAAEAFTAAIQTNPDFAYAYYCLANVRRQQGRTDEARKLATTAIEKGYDVPEDFLRLLD